MSFLSTSSNELVRACSEIGSQAVWEEFVRRFHRLIVATVWRTAQQWGNVTDVVLEDIVQEVYLKICAHDYRILRQFVPRSDDSIYSYLKVITANVTRDHMKALRSSKRWGEEQLSADGQVPPNGMASSNSPDQTDRDILIREVDTALKRLNAGPQAERDRIVFWLYYRQGLTSKAIASMPSIGLSSKGVESLISRLTRLLRRELAPDARISLKPLVEGNEQLESL